MLCPRCSGSGKCPDCGGEGSQECPVCSGAGVRHTTRGVEYGCKACSGQGSLPCPPQCSSCEGSGEITEELQKKVRDTYTVRFVNMSPASRVTNVLLGLNIFLFLAARMRPEIASELVLQYDVFSTGRYWTLLTAPFLHLEWWHVLCNMSFLRFYGPVVEGILGSARYLGVYLASALGGSAVAWFAHAYVLHEYWSNVGASGALFGLTGSLLALYIRWRMVPWESLRPLVNISGLILVLGFGADYAGFSLIDNWAHLGGLITGFLLTAALPRPQGH